MFVPGTWTASTEPWRSINSGSTFSGLWLNTGTTTLDGTYIQMFAPQQTSNPGGMRLVSNSPGATGNGFNFVHHDFTSGSNNSLMDLTNWGHLIVRGGVLDLHSSTYAPGPEQWRAINCGTSDKGLWLNTGTTTSDGTYIQIHAPYETTNPGAMKFVANSPVATGTGFSFVHHDFLSSADNSLMDLDNWGHLRVKGALLELYSTALGTEQWRAINCASTDKGLWVNTGTTTTDGTYIQMHAPGEANPGAMEFVSNSAGATGTGFKFLHHDFGSTIPDNKLMEVDNWGHLRVNGALLELYSTALGTEQWRAINCASTNKGLWVNTGTTTTDGTYIQMHAPVEPTNPGGIDFVSQGNSGMGFTFSHYHGTLTNDMRIYNSGKVAIGKNIIAAGSVPEGYLLYVEKGILTEHVRVASHGTTSWADFVFNKGYNLMSLDKVEEYIKKNKHLPEIPSAAEVAKDGIDLAEIDAKLLQKIEELTLHVIEQQKRIESLEKQAKK
ncbi:MAG: hypothetical protein K9G49_07670 [Taibaiella sp.]|nr:hypothetical protein [Taibaiella sp.]